MNFKNLMVSFLLIVSVVLLATATVSAVSVGTLGTITSVEVDGLDASGNDLAIVSGDTIRVRVEFTSNVTNQDVTVEVELEGNKKDVKAETRIFDIENGSKYVKTLNLEVPFDLKDDLSHVISLNIKVSGDGDKEEISYTLRVQRESFNADIKSVSVPQTITAGDTLPVDVVLRNIGYNDLDDLYITASIPALGIERTGFFGDLVAIECDDDDSDVLDNNGVPVDRKCNEDDEDTLNGRLFLQVPFSAESGLYTLEVEVENDDTTSSQTVQVEIKNAFSSGNFIVSGNSLLIVNPTNDVVVYRLVPASTNAVSVSISENLVAVSAGSSKMVTVDATSSVAGTHSYSVSIFSSDGTLVDTVEFAKAVKGRDATSPIVVLTVILAIIFLVLLVVLIVLIGKKPETTEDFGESYY